MITKGSLRLFPSCLWEEQLNGAFLPSLLPGTGKEWCTTRSQWHFLFGYTGNIWKLNSCRTTASKKFTCTLNGLKFQFFQPRDGSNRRRRVDSEPWQILIVFRAQGVILTGHFSVCFSNCSKNILALVLPTQILFIWVLLWWAWFAILHFLSNLLISFLLDGWVDFKIYLK